MRLTAEEDKEAIKRYRHIKPGGVFGLGACAARCPGSERTCTLERGHRGPHVAHGRFKRVMAVWDAGHEIPRSAERVRPAVRQKVRGEVWTGGFGGLVEMLWRAVDGARTHMGEIALLMLFLGFVAFAIDWFLRIF